MARRLRSGRSLENPADLDLNVESEAPQLITNQLEDTTPLSLPTPGVDTQAIIEELVNEELDLNDLDELLENNFLLFSPSKENSQPPNTSNSSALPPELTETQNTEIETAQEKQPAAKKRGRRPKQSIEKQCPVCPKASTIYGSTL